VAGRPVFTPDGRAVLLASNRRPDSEYEPSDTEIYELSLADGALRALTDRRGPDFAPAVSPDGRSIAYLGFDERYQGYQVRRLYVMNRDGSGSRSLGADFDRDASDPDWSGDGKGLFFSTADRGNGKVAFVAAVGPTAGKVEILASDLGGGDLGPLRRGFTRLGTGRPPTPSRPETFADVGPRLGAHEDPHHPTTTSFRELA
jgi:acylaminoacyl-peptidase